ncbi:MAG: PEP/pyruvate-binding domain-containing protein [Pyrinomonadaceae bacterium]
MKFLRSSFPTISLVLTSVLLLTSVSAQSPTGVKNSSQRFLNSVSSRAQFDTIARVYHSGTPYALPHVMFVIDRRDKNKVYYINSPRYRFHQDFVNALYLSLDRGEDFFKKNYIDQNRRFILGTLAFQTPIQKWTLELWEGDKAGSDLIKLAYDAINATFFTPVAYKPNSLDQEKNSESIDGIKRILLSDINQGQEYVAMNVAKGIGRIHIIDKLDEHTEIGDNEILVLSEVPLSLPSVAGIIITKPSTPLSHVNLLAKGWGVPNAYIKNANELFKQYDGWWVTFETKLNNYSISRADKSAIDRYQEQLRSYNSLMVPKSDLTVTKLAGLREQRSRSVIAYGAKSANLGELINAKGKGFTVPDGFTIPFSTYAKFMKDNGLNDVIYDFLDDNKFVHDPTYRRAKLEEFQRRIEAGKVDPALRTELLKRVHEQFPDRGLFLRSSTNSEDLPNFNGAGLYSTKANVRGDEQIIAGLKYVWASIWNFRAYEARERSHIPHDQVYMAVLVQEGINSESAGVMITTDPYDREDNESIYISGKKGQGEKTVGGEKVAEQVIYRPRSNTVRVLTRSEESEFLTFDENGGLKQVPITGSRDVLTDEMARRLAAVATKIKKIFGNKEQDIEWAIVGTEIYIVQARPYISNRKGRFGAPLATTMGSPAVSGSR